ncbi:MAG: hypothetical protein H0W63_08310 [Gemmatimonadaceae bacterium]|nr:hypothetical protein [Gemmatimonadaceae bacterium]
MNGSLGLPASLPYSTPAPGGRIDITSGTMVLRADKTFTETFVFTNVPISGAPAPDTDVTSGTFSLSNGTIMFTTQDPLTGSHSWSGTLDATSTISYNDLGFLAVYKR